MPSPTTPDLQDDTPGPAVLALPRTSVIAVSMGIATVGLALLWVGVATGSLLASRDPAVDAWVVAVRPPWLVDASRVISDAGQPAVLIGVLVLVTGGIAWRSRSWSPVGVSAGALVLLTVFDNGVKALVARPRPPLAWHAMPAHGLSFPSGHALWSAGVLLMIVLLAARVRTPLLLGALALVIAAAVAASRVILAVHYPSDVLAGWCLAVLADGVVVAAAASLSSRRPET